MAVTFIVEDGDGIANATSYQDLEAIAQTLLDLQPSYHAAWEAIEEEEEKQQLANFSTLFLDTMFRWYGQALTTTQGKQWPRTKNYDDKGVIIPAGTMPKLLLQAHALICGLVALTPDVMEDMFAGETAVSSFETDGLKLQFNGSMAALAEQVLGERLTRIELLIRPIGCRRPPAEIDSNRQSEVRA